MRHAGFARRLGGWLVLMTLAVVLPAGAAWSQPATIAIASPKPEETIHDNTGNVPVSVAVSGAADGLRIRVVLDGRPYGAERQAPSFVLSGVERGEHVLQVQLVAAAGQVVASSEPVKFYLWQASRLLPSRKQ